MKINLRVPPDGSFLSSTLYEGVAYVLKVARGSTGPGWVDVPDDAIAQAFEDILRREENPNKIKKKVGLPMVGNDLRYRSIDPLLKALGVKPSTKITSYGSAIAEISKIAQKDPGKLTWSGTIEIRMKLGGKEITVGSDEPFLSLSLFKSCDRYGSLRVAEYVSLGETIQQSVSRITALLCLLGIYSSYIGRFYDANLFLFLDPSEVANVLGTSTLRNLQPSDVVKNMLRVKNVGKDIIAKFLQIAMVPSAVLARIALGVELTNALAGTNINALRMRLVRIEVENRQTYKVYNDIPIEARREPLITEELAKELSKHVSPNSPLTECIGRFVLRGRKKIPLCEENDHVLKAVDALYRFVALKDPISLAEYARHLRDSISVLDAAIASGATSKSSWRRDTYKRWLSKLSYVLTSY